MGAGDVRDYKCYECKEKVKGEIAIRDSIGSVNKYFHPHCHDIYLEKKKNREQMVELTKYIEKEIMLYDDNDKLSKTMVRRLQEIRAGKKISWHTDIPYKMNEGTPYKIIYLTAKLQKNTILKAISGKEFKNELMKFYYICAIIENNIRDTKNLIENRRKSRNKLEKISDKDDSMKVAEDVYKVNDTTNEESGDDSSDFDEIW